MSCFGERSNRSPHVGLTPPSSARRGLSLSADTAFSAELQRYLRVHSTLPRALEMFFTYIALSARVDWNSAPEPMRPIAARAWFLGR